MKGFTEDWLKKRNEKKLPKKPKTKKGRPKVDGEAVLKLHETKKGISKEITSTMQCQNCGYVNFSIKFTLYEMGESCRVQCPKCLSLKVKQI